MKRAFQLAIALLAAWVVLIDVLIHPDWLGVWPRLLTELALVLGACALMFGSAHMAYTHSARLVRGEPYGAYGAILVTSLVVTFVIGVALPEGAALSWIFRFLYTPLQATMLGLMTFVLLGALYRVARFGQRGALWLVGMGLAILLLQLLASDAVSPVLPELRDWVLRVPVTAAMRGILLGIALGTTAAGLRILFGADRPYVQE